MLKYQLLVDVGFKIGSKEALATDVNYIKM